MNKYVQRARSEESGFTLIELMIVIVILGVLAGIVIFAVGGITDNGNVAACKSDVKTVDVAVEAYKAKNGSFPADLDPTLTTDPNKFLRPQTGLSGSTLVNASGGYTVTYSGPPDGTVDAGGFC
jgi:prepilin-type N-terminal cleavage/methylation domain-containing protein